MVKRKAGRPPGLKTLPELPTEMLAGKLEGKNIRAPIGQEVTIGRLSKDDKVRMAQGRQTSLDASFYERLPEYQDRQLFWENNINGAVEMWLQLGAELVQRQSKALKHYKGFTDRAASEWECVPVGSDDSGKTMMCYLLSLSKQEYYDLRIAPNRARNREITQALKRGKTQEQVMKEIQGIQTYAPVNPDGKSQGFDQTHETFDA